MEELKTIRNLADEELTLLELINKINDLCGYNITDFISYEELLESSNIQFTLNNNITINVIFTVVRFDEINLEESDVTVSEADIL